MAENTSAMIMLNNNEQSQHFNNNNKIHLDSIFYLIDNNRNYTIQL